MKTKILIATLLVAAISASIYFYLVRSKQIEPPIPKFDKSLVGNWKIDTAYNISDSNKLSVIIPYLFKDSTTFKFNADSTLQIISAKETETQKYYLNRDSLFVKSDSTNDVSIVKFINDSTLSLTSLDSTVTVFSKLK
ncbi:MAG: hypothetical protein NTZ59_07670 [Bacteroidetes bacterium]|jgi:hypothetical protein|nr:hypothetical protein [Bacteroidota bacterium]